MRVERTNSGGGNPCSGGRASDGERVSGFDAGSEIRRWERGKLTTQWKECYRCAPRGWRRAQSRVAGAGAEKRAGAAGPMPRAKNGAESAESRRGMGRTPTPMSSERGAGRRGERGAGRRAERRRREPKKRGGRRGRCQGRNTALRVRKTGDSGRRGLSQCPAKVAPGAEPSSEGGGRKSAGGGGVDTEPPDQRQRPTKRGRLTGERSCVIRKRWAARTNGGAFIGNKTQQRGGIRGRTPLL
ncbi:hypothetical protein B0H14DRAFT_2584911 [Mycena olivaceomarginata]|nr:hypothetical protein B0H14DRAFT_2584911 [Mycena olivaceomarginata]